MVANPPSERPTLDLLAEGFLAALPAALLSGSAPELLAPLELLASGAALPVIAPPHADRRALAEALAIANAGYGHPRAGELARKLADPGTQVVVTGQQPGLFGGPLYVLTKALATARWAAALEAAGRPAVAVFWVSTEDHDWTEVAQARFPQVDGARTVELGPDPAPLLPVGMRTLGPGVTAALELLAPPFPGAGSDQSGTWQSALAAALERWYRPEARFGEAFCRLLAHLLGERCPLLLDSMLPAVKEQERPSLERLVTERLPIAAAVAAAEARLAARGFSPQVHPQPDAGQLFVLRGGERRRVVWHGPDQYSLRGGAGPPAPVEELLAMIAENPAAVSPGVLARPAVQDAILGSALFVVGPGELAYLTQAAAVYPVLGVRAPNVALRPQALVLESPQVARLAEWGGRLGDLLRPGMSLDQLLGGTSGAELVAPLRESVAGGLEELRRQAMTLDPTLERPWEKTRDQIERALEMFAGKVAAAAARRDDTLRQRLEKLRAAALPGGAPQERSISTAYFAAKYGPLFVERFWEQLDLDPRWLQVIVP